MSAAPEPAYLTIPQLARRLGCAHSTLYAQLKTGTFPFPVTRVGADVRVPLEAVLLTESGVTTELAALRAELAADRAARAAHDTRQNAIVGALLMLLAPPPPAVVGLAPATVTSVPAETLGGSNLAGGGRKSRESRDMESAGLPERAPRGCGAGGTDGGHRRAAGRDGARRGPAVATGTPG